MNQFFAEPSRIGEHEIRIGGTDVNHIKHVLRMQPGEQICVVDAGSGREYRCELAGYEEGEAVFHILWSEDADRELSASLILFQCLPKGDKMETVIQKAVELGAAKIVPVLSRRCVVRLDGKRAAAKQKRWNAIAESAAKQCRRSVIPEVHEILKFSEAIEYAGELDMALIPYERAKDAAGTGRLLAGVRPGKRVGIFIGPEGGFEEEEILQAAKVGIHPITLGRRILRTETAGMAVLSLLMFHLEGIRVLQGDGEEG